MEPSGGTDMAENVVSFRAAVGRSNASPGPLGGALSVVAGAIVVGSVDPLSWRAGTSPEAMWKEWGWWAWAAGVCQ